MDRGQSVTTRRVVTGSKGLLLDVGFDHSLLLVIDRFDGNGDVISA